MNAAPLDELKPPLSEPAQAVMDTRRDALVSALKCALKRSEELEVAAPLGEVDDALDALTSLLGEAVWAGERLQQMVTAALDARLN